MCGAYYYTPNPHTLYHTIFLLYTNVPLESNTTKKQPKFDPPKNRGVPNFDQNSIRLLNIALDEIRLSNHVQYELELELSKTTVSKY